MTRNDDAALVRNKGIARIEQFHVTDDLGQRVELHRPVDDADQRPVLQHRIGEHTDELARGAGDRRRCKKRLFRLAHLLDVVARRAIHILSRIAVRLPLRRRKGDHRKAWHLCLQRLQGIDALLARAVRDDGTAGKPVQQIRLALHIVGELHGRHLPNQLCVLAHTFKQLTARRVVADGRKNDEADQKERQQYNQKLRCDVFDLHDTPLFPVVPGSSPVLPPYTLKRPTSPSRSSAAPLSCSAVAANAASEAVCSSTDAAASCVCPAISSEALLRDAEAAAATCAQAPTISMEAMSAG